MKRAALVITTYNSPRLLGICLKSLSNQSYRDFDVFIADDGSTPETQQKVESLQHLFPKKIQYFWHEDRGYNKAEINNEVFRHLDPYEVVICIDGDTFSHYRFVEDHLRAHQTNEPTVFMGRRIDLGEELSKKVTEENVTQLNRGLSIDLLISWLKGDTTHLGRAIRIAHPVLHRWFKRDRVDDLLGSNFSVSKNLLLEVNGYNEDYKSYWGEDGDLFIRLRNTGAKLVGLKSYAIQYHLFHPRLEPSREHQDRYESLLNNKHYTRCPNGIRKTDA